MTFPWFATSKSGPAEYARRALIAASLCWALAYAAPAEEKGEDSLPVEISLDRERARLGEPILMTVTVRHDEALAWEERSAEGREGSFRIEQISGPEAVGGADAEGGAGEAAGTRWVFRLAAFDLGTQEIPEIRLRYLAPGEDSFRSVTARGGAVEVVGTLAGTDEEPADIRHGFTLPAGWTLYYVLAGAAVAALGAALLFRSLLRRRRRAPGPETVPVPPSRPAYDRYREALESLLAERLAERGEVKLFHVRLSEILKRYLGEIAGFDAVDRTTLEVMEELAASGADGNLRSETGRFLEACDRVKFARHRPGAGEWSETVGAGWRILELGRRAGAAGKQAEAGA